MAFKRSYYFAEWDSKVTASTKADFIDNFFADCAQDGLNGLIIGREGGSSFILEGDDGDVDSAIGTLDAANVLVNGTEYLTEGTNPRFTCLQSHTPDDCRDST